MEETARQFGLTLDRDQFNLTKKLLSQDCTYTIGDTVLRGPESICESYEQNMLEGRKKLDVLEWGKSTIEPIGNAEFYVHFVDYLMHKGKKHTHRCKQKLLVNADGLISSIEHIHDHEEQNKLDEFYRAVGLK